GVAARAALPVPRPAPADRDLDLHDRLEPVDVGALEESDLDQSHGRGIVLRAHGPSRACRVRPRRRLPDMDTLSTQDTVTNAELAALEATVRADEPAYLADLERLVN